MHGQVDLAIGAFSELFSLELQLFQLHICQFCFLAVILARSLQLPRLQERCRFLKAFHLDWVQLGDDLAAESVLATRALVLVPQLPVLV